MKTTAFVSIALAVCVLVGHAAVADPIARNHPNSKSQPERAAAAQSNAEKAAPEYQADAALMAAEPRDPDPRTAEARRAAPN